MWVVLCIISLFRHVALLHTHSPVAYTIQHPLHTKVYLGFIPSLKVNSLHQ